MMPDRGAHRLGLFSTHPAADQPRDLRGRFTRVRLTPERRLVLEKAAAMRRALGLPPLTVLLPRGERD